MKLGSFIGGLAKSLDERLQDDMRRTQERSERVRDYHIRRSTEKQERFEAEQRELEEVLTNLASLVEDAEVPEGMNKMDYAAQLYKAGGGTVSGGQQFYANLSDARLKGTKVSDVVTFADMQTGGRKVGDYVDQFVKRPETLVKVPEGLKGGVGFLAKADITKGLDEEMQTMFGTPKDVEKFDIGQATIDYGKLPGAVEYGKAQQLVDLQIEQAAANLAETKRKANIENAFTFGEFRSQLNDITRTQNYAGVPLNSDGSIDVQTAIEENIDLGDTLTDLVRRGVKSGDEADGTFINPKNIAAIVQLASTKDAQGGYAISTVGLKKDTKPVAGTVYDMKNSQTGAVVPHLYIADRYIPLY